MACAFVVPTAHTCGHDDSAFQVTTRDSLGALLLLPTFLVAGILAALIVRHALRDGAAGAGARLLGRIAVAAAVALALYAPITGAVRLWRGAAAGGIALGVAGALFLASVAMLVRAWRAVGWSMWAALIAGYTAATPCSPIVSILIDISGNGGKGLRLGAWMIAGSLIVLLPLSVWGAWPPRWQAATFGAVEFRG